MCEKRSTCNPDMKDTWYEDNASDVYKGTIKYH